MLKLRSWQPKCPNCQEVRNIALRKGTHRTMSNAGFTIGLIGILVWCLTYLTRPEPHTMSDMNAWIYYVVWLGSIVLMLPIAWVERHWSNKWDRGVVLMISIEDVLHLHLDTIYINDPLRLDKQGTPYLLQRSEPMKARPEYITFRLNAPTHGRAYCKELWHSMDGAKGNVHWQVSVADNLATITFQDDLQYFRSIKNRLVWRNGESLPLSVYLEVVFRHDRMGGLLDELAELRKAFERYWVLAHATCAFMEETGAVKRSKPLEEAHKLLSDGLAKTPELLGFGPDGKGFDQLSEQANTYVQDRRIALGLTYGPKSNIA